MNSSLVAILGTVSASHTNPDTASERILFHLIAVLNSGLIIRTTKYYATIAVGLGLLGILLISMMGGGGEGGAFISGILTLVIFTFAILCGPLIAAMVGFATSTGTGEIRQRSVNSGIANGIGFAVYGILVFALLTIALTILLNDGGASTGAGADAGTGTAASSGGEDGSGGGGTQSPLPFIEFISLLAIMMVPNALVGGGITFFLGNRADKPAH